MKKTLMIAVLIIFAALLVAGSFVSIMDMISFGLTPVLLLALLMGGPVGAIAALLGECIFGLLSGSLISSIIAGCIMGLTCFVIGWLVLKKNIQLWLAGIIAVGIYCLLDLSVIWYTLGMAAVMMTYLPVLINAACNAAIAVILAYLLKKPMMEFIGKMMVPKQTAEAAESTKTAE
jgi:uncharacterized membrane protein